MEVLHWIGTKPLTFSMLALVCVLAVARLKQDAVKVAETLTLLVARVLIIVSLSLRPPSPVDLVPDVLGTIAAVLLLVPAVKALGSLRSPST